MNPQPIETAHDADLRLSMVAMQRAARRARELAAQTGTRVVVSRNGVVTEIEPTPTQAVPAAHAPTVSYLDKA
ncbi:hypothetical protein [Derxia lacustris]|uniref:hypothetical protein n=1 Tax=Derxia lacustris TaxID=764842 RepID=UPI000A1787E3|nr:hypothetical protein [Derxia lacustris]